MNLTQINENIVRIKKSGEIIIPAKLREFFPWLNQDNLIEAKPTRDGLLLSPLESDKNSGESAAQKKTTAEWLKEFAELAKNDQSTGMSAVEFIRKDRQSH